MIIEIVKYGDFDMPYTDSIWYSKDNIEIDEFNAWGRRVAQVKSENGITIQAENGVDPNDVADEFKNYLKKEGWEELKTTTVTFTD